MTPGNQVRYTGGRFSRTSKKHPDHISPGDRGELIKTVGKRAVVVFGSRGFLLNVSCLVVVT